MSADSRIEFFQGPPGWKLEQRTYEKGGRAYWVHGPNEYTSKRLPGVTSALGAISKPALLTWYARQQEARSKETAWELAKKQWATREGFDLAWSSIMGDVIQAEVTRDAAAEIGSAVHAACEKQTRFWLAEQSGAFGALPVDIAALTPTVADAYNQWLAWVDENDVTFIAAEVGVYSQRFGYCGQVDAVAMVGGRRILSDYKTGKSIYGEATLQCSAYAVAYAEWYGAEIEGAVIVRLPKLPGEGFEVKQIDAATLADGMDVFRCAQAIQRWQAGEQKAWRESQKETK